MHTIQWRLTIGEKEEQIHNNLYKFYKRVILTQLKLVWLYNLKQNRNCIYRYIIYIYYIYIIYIYNNVKIKHHIIQSHLLFLMTQGSCKHLKMTPVWLQIRTWRPYIRGSIPWRSRVREFFCPSESTLVQTCLQVPGPQPLPMYSTPKMGVHFVVKDPISISISANPRELKNRSRGRGSRGGA